MKINNYNLLCYKNVIQKYVDKKLPQKLSYILTKNLIIIQNELEIYSKMLNNIIQKYKQYQIKNETLPIGVPKVDEQHNQSYLQEIDDLLHLQIEDINLYKINMDIFDYEDGQKYDSLSISDILQLQSILGQEQEQKEE